MTKPATGQLDRVKPSSGQWCSSSLKKPSADDHLSQMHDRDRFRIVCGAALVHRLSSKPARNKKEAPWSSKHI